VTARVQTHNLDLTMKYVARSLMLTAALGGLLNFETNAADWPQWRGPNRDDVSKETGLLKTWPTGGPKRVWLFENAGKGYSGPAILHARHARRQ
jgi:hypothetical protein